MFLTRLALPLGSRQVQKLLGNPYALHVLIMQAMPTPAGRVLHRIEPESRRSTGTATILIQSETKPQWSRATLPTGVSVACKELGAVFDGIHSGQVLRFRVRANPTIKTKLEGRENGARRGLIDEAAQLQWLVRKGEQGGFRLEKNGAALSCVAIDEQDLNARRGPERPPMVFRSVLFEGALTVTDAEIFKKTLSSGIGPGKAFGFGLLSVARAAI